MIKHCFFFAILILLTYKTCVFHLLLNKMNIRKKNVMTRKNVA